MSEDTPRLLWTPGPHEIQSSTLFNYQNWIENRYSLKLKNYDELWQWSVDHPAIFWESICAYFHVIFHQKPQETISKDPMPFTKWFSGSTLNYAEHIFRNKNSINPAIIFSDERNGTSEISWSDLESKVAAFANFLRSKGIKSGDRVVAYLPNIPQASVAFLATISIGAVWSSCSPDFGVDSVMDRFEQTEPSVFIACEGYFYGGKYFSRFSENQLIRDRLKTLECAVLIPYPSEIVDEHEGWICWDQINHEFPEESLVFEAVPFDHPIFILYSSGTTGAPKAITHGHGGMLLEHLKYLHLHNDVRPGERFFWYSTTGWMMWNFTHAALLTGATIVLYDGSPAFPSLSRMWKLTESIKITHFGTSAPFLVACMKTGIKPNEQLDLSSLRSIGSTGSPLPPEAFDWVYQHIKSDLWLTSMSGGTDVCTAFVGGNPMLPVFMGEIQCRALGCALYALDDDSNKLTEEVGEMVIEKPMPCMPVKFWNDENYEKYQSSYFEEYPGKWRHGDWVKITSRNSLVIYGRSDATLNRQGVRIGTSEIYRVLDQIPEIKDGLIVNLELSEGRHFMPLFVQLQESEVLQEELVLKIKKMLRAQCSPRHVPDEIIQIAEIPYTISGKKMEAPVKKILLGRARNSDYNEGSMRNPDSMKFFISYSKSLL
jgi:acetoacetyl-CoA synthetase